MINPLLAQLGHNGLGSAASEKGIIVDSYDTSGAFDPQASDDAEVGQTPSATELDERRMHVRAYQYWSTLIGDRAFPAIGDLDPAVVADFTANSVLIDFTVGQGDPAIRYIGAGLRDECGIGGDVRSIRDTPGGSLLSRLTDRYGEIVARRSPIGYEAEFVDRSGRPTTYRGILLPFSATGDAIDFIYGVISWHKRPAPAHTETTTVNAVLTPSEPDPPTLAAALDDQASLADRLGVARDSAERCRLLYGRSRASLYHTLGLAYDFALATKRAADDYAEILADAGLAGQPRAPMTPIVKLVFGVAYDPARLTEFAAALSLAERRQVAFGDFAAFIDESGGLKRLVAAERAERRPPTSGDPLEPLRDRLRARSPISVDALPAEQEFALVLVRRDSDRTPQIVGMLTDTALLERAMRKLA